MSDKFKCECGGTLRVIQEVSGSFVHEIDSDGKFDWNDKEFYGDMDEFIACSECEAVIDATAHPEGFIELNK